MAIKAILADVMSKYDNSISNKMLYALCGKSQKVYSNSICISDGKLDKYSVECLSAQLLMIGRVYAASFERRSYKDGKEKNETINKKVGDGTGSFFDDVANKLVSDGEYCSFVKQTTNNLMSLYSFNKSDKDKKTLADSIQSVVLFNKIICNTIQDYDNCSDGSITQKLSGSSKFLHFHFPSQVFIIDGFAEAHLRHYNSRSKDATLCFYHSLTDETYNSNIKRNDVATFIQEIESIINNTAPMLVKEPVFNRYLEHSCRAYLIACQLYENVDFTRQKEFQINAPRIVDAFALDVNKN